MHSIRLNSGYSMPAIGLGTWQAPPGKDKDIGDAVRSAIDLGYRHFDTGNYYKNEHIIGAVLQEKIREGKVKREDLFIVSKIWCTHHHPRNLVTAFKKSLENLRLDYMDLYLIHWPMAFKYGTDPFPKDAHGFVIPDLSIDFIDTWKMMEKLMQSGLTRSIGVGNFNSVQIDRILDNSSTIPAVNQIECHPLLNQEKLRKFCRERDIAVIAYCPLGSLERPWIKSAVDVLQDDAINRISNRLNKTRCQVLLRYQIQIGNAAIPKTSNADRLKENIDIFKFELSPADMDTLNNMNTPTGRLYPLLQTKNHPEYPFNIEF